MFARSQLAISVVAVQNFYWLREVALSWSSRKGYLGSGKHLLKNIMKKSHIIRSPGPTFSLRISVPPGIWSHILLIRGLCIKELASLFRLFRLDRYRFLSKTINYDVCFPFSLFMFLAFKPEILILKMQYFQLTGFKWKAKTGWSPGPTFSYLAKFFPIGDLVSYPPDLE